MELVKALSQGRFIPYMERAAVYEPSFTLPLDDVSNLFTNSLPVATIFRPELAKQQGFEDFYPAEYFDEESANIRDMRKQLEALKRKGRSFALRTLADYNANINQPELTPKEAAEIQERLARLLAQS